ncbi:thiamine pyrophosphokinase [Mesoplasma lactucae]|uniref:Thiamine pyrophosphokinase n=1 Tax=Mesoplasma lactucae ATCC 49193 TaxID=81460 RepID=A0A291IS51_9MOLU|nr:thiamine pyrophosphokinase [Mesoplasma lactucae]ATG97536.1 thiamine pyrophosphokinase [Mesoplasma lactucae ATCC 49193]ATZ20006.1 thiamine pyrophosphokinase [Mesoplasma lactucae ATCC 49193]MCL8217043.1 hypothetical protein [Mesoplasma lactucae ATCC 49193]
MKNKIALIVTTKTDLNYSYYNSDKFYIVGVERGCLDLIDKNIKIDLAISDFDHVLDGELDLIKSKAKKFIQLKSDKDELDGIAAIEYVNEIIKPESIKFVSKPTKRYDMDFSVLDILNKYHNVEIFNDDSLLKRFEPGENEIIFDNHQDMTYISFFSLENNNHIQLSDLKYEYDGNLDVFSTRCISNAFISYKNPKIKNEKPLIVVMTK